MSDTDRILALADEADTSGDVICPRWAVDNERYRSGAGASDRRKADGLRETAAALRALVAERQAVLDLHWETLGFCYECEGSYPCPTVRALGVTAK